MCMVNKCHAIHLQPCIHVMCCSGTHGPAVRMVSCHICDVSLLGLLLGQVQEEIVPPPLSSPYLTDQ